MICDPPWQKKLSHVPADLIPVLQTHNGFTFDPHLDYMQLFKWSGKKFKVDTSLWYEPDSQPSTDPFSLKPLLMPLHINSNAWVYHPTERGPRDTAILCYLPHETGEPSPKKTSIGAVILEEMENLFTM